MAGARLCAGAIALLTGCGPGSVEVMPATGTSVGTSSSATTSSETTTPSSDAGSTTIVPDASSTTTSSETTTGDSATTSGTTGSAAVCGDAMVGVDEACDDGNDVALDGCLRDCREGPTGVTFTPGTVVGYQGASADNDDDQVCPAGEVLIGFRGQAQNVLTRLGSVCGSLVFDDGPAGLSVTISESMVFPELGPGGGGDFNALCPADHVVTGLAGRAGGSLDRLIVTCSALTVTDDLGTTFTLDLGDPIDLDPIGGGGGSAFGPTDCAPGEAVTAMSIGWGSDVDGFAFTCSELAFEGP